MVAAGLSRYLQQRYAEEMNCQGLSSMKMIFEDKHSKKIMKKKRLDYLRVRACIMVNLRKSPGLQELERMMNGGPEVRWGNQMSYSILPVPVAIFDNPLEYVVRSKSIIDKKKVSLGALFAYQSGTMLMNLVGSEMPTRLTLNCSDHTTLAFSSVFGPLEQVEFFGHKITHIIPTVVGQPQALCVHVQTYMGKATVVVCTAMDVIPDPERLCENIGDALKSMKQQLSNESIK